MNTYAITYRRREGARVTVVVDAEDGTDASKIVAAERRVPLDAIVEVRQLQSARSRT